MTAAIDGDDAFAWAVRRFVYATVVERGTPPTPADAAAALGSTVSAVESALLRLHDRHALFVERAEEGYAVRMAHPFSGIPTAFRVTAGGIDYWANCAWDALGIPAVLGTDATIEAAAADDDRPVRLRVAGGRLHAAGELVHFLLPFRRWYDDLVFT